MTQVLIVKDDLGRVTFHSEQATAGVCLGLFAVPYEGATYNFPDFTSQQGFVLDAQGGSNTGFYGWNRNNGWLQFVLPYGTGGFTVALFAR
ncbi:MAG: hypothetical protein M3Y65_09810 [Pseudomonadota bacterium]|nr:hypothetical protein [Pseudomonadota bacterium]